MTWPAHSWHPLRRQKAITAATSSGSPIRFSGTRSANDRHSSAERNGLLLADEARHHAVHRSSGRGKFNCQRTNYRLECRLGRTGNRVDRIVIAKDIGAVSTDSDNPALLRQLRMSAQCQKRTYQPGPCNVGLPAKSGRIASVWDRLLCAISRHVQHDIAYSVHPALRKLPMKCERWAGSAHGLAVSPPMFGVVRLELPRLHDCRPSLFQSAKLTKKR